MGFPSDSALRPREHAIGPVDTLEISCEVDEPPFTVLNSNDEVIFQLDATGRLFFAQLIPGNAVSVKHRTGTW